MTQINKVGKKNTNVRKVRISRNDRLKDANLLSLTSKVGGVSEPAKIDTGLTFRNLIIPRVVKAIRNIDTHTGC